MTDKWDKENLTKFTVWFHNKKDTDILTAITKLRAEGNGTSNIFRKLMRDGVDSVIEEDKG